MRLTFFIFFGLFFSVGFAQKNEFNWLIGTWKIIDQPVYEVWTIGGDKNSLSGISYQVKDGDTLITEEIKLKQEQNTYYYIPDVAGDQQPVGFKITYHDELSFTAENPAHDFPKIIKYKLVRKDNRDWIKASIEGDGKIISYVFEKIQ